MQKLILPPQPEKVILILFQINLSLIQIKKSYCVESYSGPLARESYFNLIPD